MYKKGLKYIIVLIYFSIVSCNKESDRKIEFKNVLMIVADDHANTAVGCYGNEHIRTPNIDRLAQQGTMFTNAYSNSPICSASRQSLLTGKYPHATGVNLLFTPFNDEKNYTIAEHLRSSGFKTGIIGKTHFNNWIYWSYWKEWPDYGFDTIVSIQDWKSYLTEHPAREIPSTIKTRNSYEPSDDVRWTKNSQVLPTPRFDKDSEGSFFAQKAIEFMEENKENRFFLCLAFNEPHAPFNFPVEYAGRYHPDSLSLPTGTIEDDRWIPDIFKDLSDDERKGIMASYYTSVEYMDKNVGLVLDALKQYGLDENTLVIYLGDQGYLLNEHKRFEKHTMWAESIKAPLIISGINLPGSGKIENPVEFIDLAPTIFEATGTKLHDQLQGISLWQLLQGRKTTHSDYVFAEFLEDNKVMIASKKWKYIFTTGKRDLGNGYATGQGPSGIIHRLYDLENDPKETTNLANKVDFQETVAKLQEVLLEKFMDTHPMAVNVPSGLNTLGKIIWFCEPNDVGAEPGVDLQRIFENTPDY